MLAVWSWLRELVELEREITAEEAAAALTSAGLEVEELIPVASDFEGVVIAQVVAVAKHPQADKLTVVDVIDRDGGSVTKVVCGAPNVPEPGGRVVWARPGARLPGGFEIGKKTLKGVESAGMLCSESELGLGEDHDGIIVLEDTELTAALGAEARDALGWRDYVLDIGAPANRPDTLGHRGIARELVALLGGVLLPVEASLDGLTDDTLDAAELVDVAIADPQGCPRYTARIIDGVTVGQSPRWLRRRLQMVGVRPLSNLIDVTNYVMFELGQPLHAFDYAKLGNQRIEVRRARAGEKMHTLDDIERELTTDDILICDGNGPVALGGVMGGLDSEVSSGSSRVLLESAAFQPISIRRTAKRLGLHSESSHRFERGVDPNGAELASARASRLLAELGGGKVVSGVVDVYPAKSAAHSVSMRVSRASQLTGLELTRDQAVEVLRKLDLDVKEGQGDVIEVSCPTFRPDLTREVDLIEEVVRLYGLDRVPATLPVTTSRPSRVADPRPDLARNALVAIGMSEAITFGFTSPKRIESLRLPDNDWRARPIVLKNPMTIDQSVMRTSLLPNLLAAVARNIKYDVRDIRLFEVGHVFDPSKGGELPEEPRHVAGVLAGRRPRWLLPGADLDFYDAKGAVERLLEELLGPDAGSVKFTADQSIPYFHPGVCAVITTNGIRLGEIGEVHPDTRIAMDIEVPVFGFDLDLEAFPMPPPRQLSAIPRYPASTRDVSFFVGEAVPAGRVRELIAAVNEPLLQHVTVLEEYRDSEKVPKGKKGMLWSITYRSMERTLTDKEVDAAHEAIVDSLLSSLPAERR